MRVFSLVKRDLQHIFRDGSILIVLFIPLIFWGLLRFSPPIYEPFLPVLTEYRLHFLAVFSILSSVFLGYIIAFIILEEKDENLIPLFCVMPVSVHHFMLIRTLLIFCLSFISDFLLILTTGLVQINIFRAIILALICSTTGPAITFLITAFAQNKIEGVTLFKFFSFVIIAPIAGLFLTSGYSLLFGIIPYYWIYSGFIGNPFISEKLSIGFAILFNFSFMVLTYKLAISKLYR